MEKAKVKQRRAVNWLLVWCCWILVSVFDSSEVLLASSTAHPSDIWRQVLLILVNSHIWFGLTFLVVRLVRLVPIQSHKWWKGFSFHIVAFAFISTLQIAIYAFVIDTADLVSRPQPYVSRFQNLLLFRTTTNLIYYAAILIITLAVDYYRKYQYRDLAASQLETKLAQSQLRMLKMQLHPHFLFNTLNTISVLMEKDVRAANRMLVRLSDLLRITLEDIGEQEVTLKQEIEYVQRYLEIELTRFGDRLQVKMKIEPRTLDALVPNFILQPLVENAIRYGIAPKLSDGIIEIKSTFIGEMLHLFVSDNGLGLDGRDMSEIRKGIGLSNTQARLEQLYGTNYDFLLSEIDTGGFLARVVIPFRTEKL